MAKTLLHLPMDKGIDQSKDTGGSEPSTGLVTCENLWHQKRGVLSTRPGTVRDGGVVSTATLSNDPVAAVGIAENLAVALISNSVYGQIRPQSTEDQGWFDLDGYAAPVPTTRREVGDPTWTARNVAVWRHLVLVAYSVGSNGFIQAYDRLTGALLDRTSFTAGTGMAGGWACHGDNFPPTLYRWDNGTGIRRHVMTDETDGRYLAAGVAMDLGGGTVTGAILVCGHDDGSAHIGETAPGTGSVVFVSSTAASAVSYVGTVGVALGSCASYGGRAWFCGIASGDIYVLTADGASLVAVNDTPTTASQTQACIVPTATTTATVFSNSSTDVYLCTVNAVGALGGDAIYMEDAYVVGGASYDGMRSRAWFRINRNGASTEFGKFVLVDVSASQPTNKSIVMDSGILFGVAVANNLYPQASADGQGGFAVAFPHTTVGAAGLQPNIFDFRMAATRPIVPFMGRAYIPGGVLYDVDADAGETLHAAAPVIISATAGTSGNIPNGTYQFVAVYQRRDSAGVVRYGALSEAETITLSGSNDSVAILLAEDDTLPPEWEVVIYRTEVNGIIYYRDSDPLAAIRPGDTFTSTQIDSLLIDNEILYTEGGVLFNHAAPSHRFAAAGKRRLWIGGLWYPFRLQFSKETLRGEAPAFPDHPTHWLDLDKDVTGIACIDDCILAFHRDSVDLVTGDGPNIQGTDGSFQVRPCTIGAGADDWRSVVVTPIGVFFAGQRTIWLMGRGFGAPENVGAMVQDILEEFPVVLSSAFVDYGHQQCVQFLCGNLAGTEQTRLVFSLRSLAWYQWDAPAGSGLLGECFVRDERRACILPAVIPDGADFTLLVESEDVTTDEVAGETETITAAIETHDVHSWGLATDARVNRVWFRARVAETQTWNAELIYDGGRSIFPINGRKPMPRDGYQIAEYRLTEQALNSLALRLETGPVTLAGMVLEIESEGAAKLATVDRRG